MNKKTIYIIVAVLVVIIVVAAAAIALTYKAPAKTTVSVAKATSLQFSVNDTTSTGVTATYKFAGQNMGTTNLTIRIDVLGGAAGNYSYIVNSGQEKSWSNINGGAWTAGNFTSDWINWGSLWSSYVNNLGNWTAGNVTYTASNGDSIKIFDISVNPTLAASLFLTS